MGRVAANSRPAANCHLEAEIGQARFQGGRVGRALTIENQAHEAMNQQRHPRASPDHPAFAPPDLRCAKATLPMEGREGTRRDIKTKLRHSGRAESAIRNPGVQAIESVPDQRRLQGKS
ncbi:MAG: hypothetical protein FD160_3716 [Caulobacteraceae bacterium]|nr:MAG: hypothetical protein FD160_3716 [Caulobacteraceae bacterium]